MKTKLEINLSASALSHAGCVLNFFRTVVGTVSPETGQSEGGYKELAMASRMVYGVAGHKFIDTCYQTGGNIPEAVKAAKIAFALPKFDDKRCMHLSDERHMITVSMMLWTGFCQDDSSYELLMFNDKPASEQTFKIKFYEDDIAIYYLCGTLDKLGQFKGGCFAIGDWKFTSSWDRKKYFKQYELSRPLRVYALACKLMSQIEPNSTLGKIGATRVGAFIDAIFLKPSANDMEVERSVVHQFEDKELKDFQEGITNYCKKISRHIKENYFPKEGIVRNGCDGKWGLCSFWNVCKSSDNVAAVLLARDFKRVMFTPEDYNNLN